MSSELLSGFAEIEQLRDWQIGCMDLDTSLRGIVKDWHLSSVVSCKKETPTDRVFTSDSILDSHIKRDLIQKGRTRETFENKYLSGYICKRMISSKENAAGGLV
uniref:Uncharacterized protein n=1 Tax=Amphimedon queenslandica TaxID=400682 RepID=A0A1X7U218_AMPQE